LRDVERGLVHEAIHDGFTVFNSEYSSTIYGDSTLDVLLPVSEQAAWFENPIAANRGRPYVRRDRQQPALAHSELKFRRFSQRPDAEMILDALSLYLTSCTPFPRLTESDYWGLSSPGWKNKGWTRVITLNMSFLEVLWMVEPRGGSGVSVNMGVDYQFLPPKKTEKVLRKFGAEMLGSLHKSGGPFEEVLSFDSVRSFTRAMQDSQDIRTAAARFALDRMRRGYLSGRYRDSHDVLLTGEALGRMSKWDHLGR
jgi:hypothetical protein